MHTLYSVWSSGKLSSDSFFVESNRRFNNAAILNVLIQVGLKLNRAGGRVKKMRLGLDFKPGLAKKTGDVRSGLTSTGINTPQSGLG